MKRGFTLIELLAVIIILAVIALIATPIVLDVVENAQLKAFEESAYGIIETVKLKNYDDMFEGTNENKTYIFPNDELVFQGERPKGGTVISQNGEIILAIHNDKYCAMKKFGDEKVTITDDISNCDIKYVNLNGTLSEANQIGTNNKFDVQLIKNDSVIYATTSDNEGNYTFSDIVADNYLLLISKPKKTKYGREISLNENTTYDINDMNLYDGDINSDNIIDDLDTKAIIACYNKYVSDNKECAIVDVNDNGLVDGNDLSIAQSYYGKISDIKYLDTFKISGKVISSNGLFPTIKVGNNTISINDDGTFAMENITKGLYVFNINKDYYLGYKKVVMYTSDVSNLVINLYAGDVNADGVINDDDIVEFESLVEFLPESVDFNGDGVADELDKQIIRANFGKTVDDVIK